MPRRGRLILPDMPHHIVQRGHNRHAVFVEEADYQYYLSNLIEWKLELQMKVYSYCLMENHIHIIVDPGEFPANVGELMKRLAARQTRYVNKMQHRTGSLWDSRYKISPIESDGYLLQCSRYVDLNPVKAKMCANAEQYRWSSYRAKLGMVEALWLDSDPCYSALGDTVSKRRINYKAFVEDAAGANETHQFIQTAISRNQLTGSSRFINEVEKRTGVRIEYRGRGRPAAQEDDE